MGYSFDRRSRPTGRPSTGAQAPWPSSGDAMLGTSLSDTAVLRRERRRDPRLAVTRGTVWIGGEAYPLSDLSARGFRATAFADDRIEGAWVDIRLAVRLSNLDIDISGKARVVWLDRDRQEIGAALFRMEPGFYKAIDDSLSRAAQETAPAGQSVH